MERSRFIAGLAGGVAVAVARPARAQTTMTVTVGTLPSSAEIWYAIDNGFFAHHGLDVQYQMQNSGAAGSAAMLGGSIDISESDTVTIIKAHDHGIPFVALAPGLLDSVKAPTVAIVVKDPSLRTGKDFNGKTFSTNSLQNLGTLLADAWIDNNGGTSSTVKWVELPFPALSPALQRGTIDAYIAPEPFITTGLKDGGRAIVMDNKPLAPIVLQGALIATRDWLASHRDAARAFRAGILDANDWANKNPAAAATILSKYSKIPVAAIMGATFRGEYALRLDPAMIQPLIDGSLKYGLISKSFRASEIIAD
jgi:NitT/TauT family transport system substrate-binding protein